MRNINKSEVRVTIRRAIETFNRGGDALWALNAGRPVGLPALTEVEGRRLQQAYTQRGEEGAVAVAVQMLRDAGFTVTDDETVTAGPEVPLGTAQVADTTPVVEAATGVDLSAVAQAVYENLLAGGRGSAIAYLNVEATRAGITLSAEQVEKIVTDFAEALGTDGLDYAEEILDEAYAALTATPEVAQAGGEETLEVRVARLEQIARDNGLL